VAILGISRSTAEPVFIEGKFRKRLILPFSLSYDHRVIDGADAARFTTRFGQLLSNLEEIT
jgi:pyruvate dehydrogenase E2 component (dihydrolipoamide acetyltransferase)